MISPSIVSATVLLLVVSAMAVIVFRRFGLGSILGLLVTGILIGPHTPGPAITGDVDSLLHFTELGVVLLLFVIGLEMHPRRLWEMRRTLFGLGSLQILLSGLVIGLYFRLFLDQWSIALLVGMSLALSSTALVIQMLHERGEMATRHGQTAFSVLLMQDLAVVPLLAMLPVIADAGPFPVQIPLWQQIATVLIMLGLVIVSGRWVVSWILDWLIRHQHRDVFLLVVLAAVFVAASAMEYAGMSLALGAFLMGMMLSGSRYSVQIEALVEPYKTLLMSLFFVAVGMSIDVGALMARPWLFIVHIVMLVGIKVIVLLLLALLFGVGRAAAVRTAFLLSQAGEFGFVIFGAAQALNVINDQTFIIAIAVISLTMLLTPVLARFGDFLACYLPEPQVVSTTKPAISGVSPLGIMLGMRLSRLLDVVESYLPLRASPPIHDAPLCYPVDDHDATPARVVIGGYGRVGHTIGAVLSSHNIPYIAFESDPELVAKWRAEGFPVYYGDIGDPHLLAAAQIERAELVVLTIDNQQAAIHATELVRSYAPDVTIVARARDLITCDALFRAGASKAFPEAVEASLRLAAETLQGLGICTAEVDELLHSVRRTDYALMREFPE